MAAVRKTDKMTDCRSEWIALGVLFVSAAPLVLALTFLVCGGEWMLDETAIGLWAAVAGVCSAFLWVMATYNPTKIAFNLGAASLSGVAIILAVAPLKYPANSYVTAIISNWFLSGAVTSAAVITGFAMVVIYAAPNRNPSN